MKRTLWSLVTVLGVVAMSASCSSSDRPEPAAGPVRTGSFADLLPRPVSVHRGRGRLVLGPDTTIRLARGAGDAAALLRSVGFGAAITFVRDDGLGPDGYRLDITDAGVTVTAGAHDGFLWAAQTLRQLRPVTRSGRVALPVGQVRDEPRFRWRGVMLDVARHWFGEADIEHVIDLASSYKLNRLHLHLTDDQGWRIQVRSHPELTRIGSRTEIGGGTGGFLTQAAYRRIVRYAARRGMTVVPEIDVPGHTNAALTSLPWLNCDGKATEPYTKIGVGFSSLCVDDDRSLAWLDDVVGEIAALTPGRWVHLGGDESKATDPAGYRRFVQRAFAVVRRHGKVPIGWEEVGTADIGADAVVQHWLQAGPAAAGAAQGAEVIASPATRAYLDQKYDDTTPVGLNWSGFITSEHAYGWDPARQVKGVPARQVVGIEAPLWTETVATRTDIDLLLVPRLPSLAEVGWTPQADRSWPDAARRLAAQAPRWKADGVAWTRDPSVPGLR